jgi:hypothetical protein
VLILVICSLDASRQFLSAGFANAVPASILQEVEWVLGDVWLGSVIGVGGAEYATTCWILHSADQMLPDIV